MTYVAFAVVVVIGNPMVVVGIVLVMLIEGNVAAVQSFIYSIGDG